MSPTHEVHNLGRLPAGPRVFDAQMFPSLAGLRRWASKWPTVVCGDHRLWRLVSVDGHAAKYRQVDGNQLMIIYTEED